MRPSSTIKNLVNYTMFAVTGLCMVIAVGILFFILGYLVYNGRCV